MRQTTKNPVDLGIHPKDLERYSPFAPFEQHRNWERCVVKSVDTTTYTCDVYTEKGKVITNLPWPTQFFDTTSAAGEVFVPKLMQRLVVHYNLGEPRLIAGEPTLSTTSAGELFIDINGRGSGTDKIDTERPSYRGPRPKDILPGDWLRIGTQGNFIGILEGGVNIIRSTNACQIVTSKTDDTIRIVSRNLDIFTDFGEIKCTNEEGRTSLSLRGGAQQLEESSPSLGNNFTIALDLGAKGDMLSFRISDPKGIIKYKQHIDAVGNVENICNDYDHIITGNKDEHIVGSAITTIEADKTETINLNETRQILGSSQEQIIGTKETVAGGALNLSAGSDFNIHTSKSLNITSTGDTAPSPKSKSINITAVNGSVVVNIGDPGNGDKQTGRSGFKLKTFNGDIEHSTKLGKIILNSPRPDSIILGGKAAQFHAVLYEQLKAFFEVFGNLIDTHVHATAVGPSSPPAVPPYQTSKAQLQLAKSRGVKIAK